MLLLERRAARRAPRRAPPRLGHDHRLHRGWRSVRHEHVLGAAQADALGAELARLARVLGRVGVGAHAEPAELVGPGEDRLESRLTSGSSSGTSSAVTTPVLPSIAIRSPSDSSVPPTRSRLACRSISSSPAPATHGLPIPRATSGVAGLAALAREDALRGVEAGDVVGLGERPHEDHVAAVRRGGDGVLGGEHDLALRGARRARHALGEHVELGVARTPGAAARRARAASIVVDRLALSSSPPPPRRPRIAPPPGRAAWRCASGACRGCPPPP